MHSSFGWVRNALWAKRPPQDEDDYVVYDVLAHKGVNDVLALITYQLAEVMDLFRKSGLSSQQRSLLYAGFSTPKFQLIETRLAHIQQSVQLSMASGIHVYDYLVALPLQGLVTAIYSADDHFQRADFQRIAPVTNPLAPWVLREGRRPIRK